MGHRRSGELVSAHFVPHRGAAHPARSVKSNQPEKRESEGQSWKAPIEFYRPRWRRPPGWSPWGEWPGRCAGHCTLSSTECSRPHCETRLSHWWLAGGGNAWRSAQCICSERGGRKKKKSTKMWLSGAAPERHNGSSYYICRLSPVGCPFQMWHCMCGNLWKYLPYQSQGDSVTHPL